MTVPRGVQEKTGCGTLCSGLVDMAVISKRLDLIILGFFSHLNGSMILCSIRVCSVKHDM